jgi:hypothetical protein
MGIYILQPVVAQIGLMVALYIWLTVARTLAVRRGDVRYDAFVLGSGEPLDIARVTRNLANQFELPILWVACIACLVALDAVTRFDVAMAWAFVAGRLAHMLAQTLTDNVPLRGQVFTANFLAFLGIAAHLALISVGLS